MACESFGVQCANMENSKAIFPFLREKEEEKLQGGLVVRRKPKRSYTIFEQNLLRT